MRLGFLPREAIYTCDTKQNLNPDYISGLSVLGGNPSEPENERELVPFLKRVKNFYPDKDIWLWTGHTMEKLNEIGSALPEVCDVIIDGPFVEELKDLSLAFRGSSNQRMWVRTKGGMIQVNSVDELNDLKFPQQVNMVC